MNKATIIKELLCFFSFIIKREFNKFEIVFFNSVVEIKIGFSQNEFSLFFHKFTFFFIIDFFFGQFRETFTSFNFGIVRISF